MPVELESSRAEIAKRPIGFHVNSMNVDESLQVLAADHRMANIIASVGEITLEPQNVPMFQSLVRSVIGQQLSRRAATAIFGRFVDLFSGESFPTAQQVHA